MFGNEYVFKMDEFTFSRKRAVGFLKTVSYEKNVCVNIFFETTFFKKIERSRENTCVIFIETNRRLQIGIGDSNEHVKFFPLEHFCSWY